MPSPSSHRRPLSSRSRRLVRLSPVAAAVSSLLLSAGAAQAQQAGDAQTITVTGIRRSIEASVTTKRDADGIVEAISAEDIGKLPDVSIAESLARVPGLAGQRVGGRVQGIQIRGLSSDFAGTLLNGREQVTTGDNRGVEFDQFPSELINAVTIYKSADAGLIGQGVSGTVDMKAIRPLSIKGRKVVLNARYEKNSNGALNAGSKDDGARFSASYVDQFANNTVGVALGFAHLDSPGQELHYKAWGFGKLNADCTAHPEWGCSQATGVPAGAVVQTGFEATAVSRSQKRDGLMAVFEFKPNDRLHSTVDLYYSKFKKDETMRGLMNGLAEGWSGNPGVAYSNVTTTRVGTADLVTAADLANTNFIVRNDKNTREDELKSLGWNLEAKLGDKWTATADLSYSVADRHENVIETYAGARSVNPTPPPATLQTYGSTRFEMDPSGVFPRFSPGLNYADAQSIYLSDPAHDWGHEGLWKKPRAKDELKALRFEAKRDFDGMINRATVGLNYSVRRKERQMDEVELETKGGRAPTLVPASLLQTPTSLSAFGIPGVLSYDVMGAIGQVYDQLPQALNEVINRNYEVEEKVSTAYLRFDFDGTLATAPVRGNFGLQVVHTNQSSHGFARFGDVTPTNPALEINRGTSYTDVLPSLNLVFDLGKTTYLRSAIGKTLARGRMDDMRAGAETSIDRNKLVWSGKGGNPLLEPWRAWSFDLSLEKYFSPRSYVAAAAYYKKLQTYIYTKRIEIDFSAFPNNTTFVPNPIGIFETPQNGEGGELSGFEFSGSLEGSMLHKALDGFGLVASVSTASSNLRPNGPDSDVRLPGLSGTLTNLTLYYEKSGFSARISKRYRTQFRGEITGLHNARTFVNVLPDRQTDLQLGYEFDSGALKGMTMLLQVNNLRNDPYATRYGNPISGDTIAPEEYNKYGRQWLFGINYKL